MFNECEMLTTESEGFGGVLGTKEKKKSFIGMLKYSRYSDHCIDTMRYDADLLTYAPNTFSKK